MESAARKFDTSNSEDAEIVSEYKNRPETPKAEEKRSPIDIGSEKFWERQRAKYKDKPEKVEGTRRAFEEQLEISAKEGSLRIKIDKDKIKPDGTIDDEDSEKIFAFQKMAKDGKFKLGPIRMNADKTGVSAEISKGREKVIDFRAYREKISGWFSREGKPAGEKKAKEILGGTLEKTFEANKDKFKGANLSVKEVLSKFDKKKLFGTKTKNFLGGMAVGAVTRASVKWATGLAGGVFVGVASGALAGGMWEGIKAYRGESKKHRELFAKKEELYRRAEAIGQEKNINLKEKLDKYFDLLKIEEEVGMVEGKNKAYAELRNELGLTTERGQKTKKGAIKGAIMGGLGGALGGIVGNYLGEYFHGTGEAGAAIKEARKTIGKETFEQIQGQVMDTYSKTYEKSVAAGLAGLDMQEFKMSARPGDGATNIARNMIHDYITEMRALGENTSFDKSQLIYAEDHLKNLISAKGIHPGDTFSLRGADILSTLQKADGLSELGKADLAKNFVPNVSTDEWARVLDYKTDFNPSNHISEVVLKEAEQAAAAAISVHDVTEGIGADAAQRIHDKIRDKAVAKAIEQGKNRWFEDLFSAVGAAYLAEQGEVVEKYINNKRARKAPKTQEREYRHADDFSEGDSDLRPEPKKEPEYFDLKEEDVVEKGDEKLIDQALPERASDEYKEIPKGKPKIEKPKIDDPIYKYLADKGFDIGDGQIEYKVRTPNSVQIFPSYKQMTRWFNKLSQKKKDWLIDQDFHADKPAIKMELPEPLKKFFDESALSRQSFNSEVDKLVKDMFGVRENISNEKKGIPPEREKERDAPKPDPYRKYPKINTGESEDETVFRVEAEEKMRTGDDQVDLVRGLGEEIKAGSITQEGLDEERRNFRKEEIKDPELEKFGSMTPDELDEEELRLRYEQDKDKENDEKYEKLYEKINFIRDSRKNAA